LDVSVTETSICIVDDTGRIVRELVENFPDLVAEPPGRPAGLREQIVLLHRRLLAIVGEDEVCRRLMTTPGVGPVAALTYRAHRRRCA
jgi:transposase